MNCVSCHICVYRLWLVGVIGVFLSSRVTGSCPVTTDLIRRFVCENNNNNKRRARARNIVRVQT